MRWVAYERRKGVQVQAVRQIEVIAGGIGAARCSRRPARVVEEILQLPFGEGPFLGGLLVVLDMGGGVPVEQDLGGMRPEALPTHLVPAIVRVADVGAEQPQSGLAAPGRRLFATFDRAQIAEELFN